MPRRADSGVGTLTYCSSLLALSILFTGCSSDTQTGGHAPGMAASSYPPPTPICNSGFYAIKFPVDADQDGAQDEFATQAGCQDMPPRSAVSSNAPIDCDDRDPTRQDGTYWYPDADGDGRGSPFGSAVLRCLGDALPGAAPNYSDCDDTNPLLQERGYLDTDGDSHGAGAQFCGSVDATSDTHNDCDDHDPTIHPGSDYELPGDGINSDCDADGDDFPWITHRSASVPDSEIAAWATGAAQSPGCEAGVDLYVLYAESANNLCGKCVTELGIGNRGGTTANAVLLKLVFEPEDVHIPLGSLEPQAWVRVPYQGKYPVKFKAVLESTGTECTPNDNHVSFEGSIFLD
jgi:hypothetical protein